eukprot:c20546_g1_i2.p1 GENE.c20546_g1_i2~~c20546_g1_i2.p1  ORF type:complete len:476 (-),score=98.51 c20546_g1_i2:70-1431(-)
MSRPENVGILGMEIYIPLTFIDQVKLEQYDGVSAGKYTIGLGQSRMAVCSDREDIVSCASNALQGLLTKYNIDPLSIGRLEVGTESPIDKSKSVKTALMEVFVAAGNNDVEGVDNINACYGGTAALLNSCAWIESSSWDGRYSIVVCGDIAVYAKGNARPSGGAGTVAILLGPNAPLVLAPGLRSSYFDHVYDFYKPDPAKEFPTVNGVLSQSCYTQAIDACWAGLAQKYKKILNEELRMDSFEYYCFHSPYNKLVRKSFARIVYNDFKLHRDDPKYGGVDQSWAEYSSEQSLEAYETLTKHFIKSNETDYEQKVAPGAVVGQNVGNMYTASVFGSLIGLICSKSDSELVGKRIAMFSYGSGLAASLYVIEVRGSIAKIAESIQLHERLAQRLEITPQKFTEIMDQREANYGRSNFEPASPIHYLRAGSVYLAGVDEAFKRSYATAPPPGAKA